jgi:hypothetical protein
VEARLRDALHARSLRVVAEPMRAAHGRTLLAYDSAGRCAFFETGRTCAIHRRLGHEALPVSCRLFPRVCLLTPRGVSVTLSHYCPTAAGHLFAADGPFRIVSNARAFPEAAHYEGLDARLAPPPLLRPGVWLGWDGHERWERHVLEVLAREGSPEDALGLLAAQAEAIRQWTVERGPFPDFLEEVLARSSPGSMAIPPGETLYEEVLSAVPEPLRPTSAGVDAVPHWGAFEAPVRRYLAARAFASWVAVQSSGLRTSVRALQAALAVLRREAARAATDAGRPLDASLLKDAIRRADLLLVHLASPEALAAAHGRCET